jgi:hypothetical protein
MNTNAQQLAERASNPFATKGNGEEAVGKAMAQTQAEATVQAMVVSAKRFPRSPEAAMNRILDACTRVSLANEALYQFPRGGSDVTGPSIRLAEVIAQNWGNIQFGINELSSSGGRSHVEAYAWDLETNVRQAKVFQAEHIRYSKKYGNKMLTDPRDVYEMVANQGARRMRSCILAIIPKDVVEAAVDQIYLTLNNSMDAPADEIVKLVQAFKAFDVTETMIKKRLGKNLDKVSVAEVIRFRQIYKSLKDGMSEPVQWFDMDGGDDGGPAPTNGASKAQGLKSKLESQAQPEQDGPTQADQMREEQLASWGFCQTPDGFVNRNGELWDPDAHAANAEGLPIINADGSFRKKRGAAAASANTENPEPSPPQPEIVSGSDSEDIPW